MVKFILIKSLDEWATTKQACRDEFVVYLFFSSTIYTSLYFYVLSTVFRKSNFALYVCMYVYIYIYIYIYMYIYIYIYIYIYVCVCVCVCVCVSVCMLWKSGLCLGF